MHIASFASLQYAACSVIYDTMHWFFIQSHKLVMLRFSQGILADCREMSPAPPPDYPPRNHHLFLKRSKSCWEGNEVDLMMSLFCPMAGEEGSVLLHRSAP